MVNKYVGIALEAFALFSVVFNCIFDVYCEAILLPCAAVVLIRVSSILIFTIL